MKKTLFILSLFLIIVNCSKSSDSKSENEQDVDQEFDINEGQTNWVKNIYFKITDPVNFIGVNDIAHTDGSGQYPSPLGTCTL